MVVDVEPGVPELTAEAAICRRLFRHSQFAGPGKLDYVGTAQNMSPTFDNQPLRYFKGHPVYLTTYLTLGLAAGTVVVVLLMAAHKSLDFLAFQPWVFAQGSFWQPLTYVFVNPISFFTPLGLYCFCRWGIEVETFLGRKRFLAVCGALLATPVIYGLVIYTLSHLSALTWLAYNPFFIGGDFYLIAGLLIAFASLYPNMEYGFGWVPLKYFAFAMVACGSLMYFPDNNWVGLFGLWLNCFVGYASIQYVRGNFELPEFKLPSLKPKPKFRVLPKPAPDEPDEDQSDVDALLDKIARSGMQSLTKSERARLESARQNLLKKSE